MPGVVLDRPQRAPHVVGPTTKSITRPAKAVPQYLCDEAALARREPFDASKHIAFEPPASVVTMADLGLAGQGISPNAVSEPFALFSREAVRQMRAEVFSEDVLGVCQFASTFNRHMIRGMGPARAPFTYAAWKSPELLAAVSRVAGIDLVTSMDFEIATVNVSVDDDDGKGDGGGDVDKKEPPPPKSDEPLGDGLSTVAWHYDSFPFVCVVMLSDCTGMVGGETALRTGSGEVMKVRGPAMGTAVVLQGRYIEHQALKSLGGRERISMVTCFRPRSAHVRDETVLTGVRAVSYRSDIYAQYAEYRLEMLEERIRARQRDERLRERARADFDVATARRWLLDQKEFIESMLDEIIDE